MDNKKISATVLIKDFFAMSATQAVKECKELSSVERQQLGSAIAREQGLLQEQLSFELVDY
jgi:hypothetical protein